MIFPQAIVTVYEQIEDAIGIDASDAIQQENRYWHQGNSGDRKRFLRSKGTKPHLTGDARR